MSESKIFVIRNQDAHFLSKKDNLWLDGSEPQHLFRTPHEDIALNTLIETNSQQIDIRGEIIQVELGDKNLPVVEVSEIESKMPVKEKPQAASVDNVSDEETSNAQEQTASATS